MGIASRFGKISGSLHPQRIKLYLLLLDLPLEAQAEELIDQDDGVWKNDLVQQIFLPHEVDAICGIALSINLPDDK